MRQRINYGVISASNMARSHMKAIQDNPNARLVAVCDLDLAKAKRTADLFGADQVYQDYRQLLDNAAIDAVVICTPDQLHREMTVAALARGKHVLCEKPMALTVADCQAMIEAERAGKARLMIGQICRYTPGFVAAKDLISRGKIGELFFVESEYAHDYSRIVGSPTADHWRRDPLRHPFLGGGCHAVDLLRWIAGNPTEVTAYANRKMLRDMPTDDCTIAIYKFPDEVIGKVFVSIGCKRNYTMRSVFYGSKGTIIADNTTPHLTIFKDGFAAADGLFDAAATHTVPVLLPVSLNNHNTSGEINDFTRCLLEDTAVTTSSVEGASTVEACLGAVKSAAAGKPVALQYAHLQGGSL
ncbi:MAG: Gfo/Idh/MocA family oxidoreductase [Clostridiaceae bacterium]|nr:Gfo/Idh/MocA family oxidoreductase [Clostridiaceae bacterium]